MAWYPDTKDGGGCAVVDALLDKGRWPGFKGLDRSKSLLPRHNTFAMPL
jgi:hypothetical protein